MGLIRKLYYQYWKLKKQNVRVGLLSDISFSSFFEGDNYIGPFSKFSGTLGRCTYIGRGGAVLGKIGRFTSIAADVSIGVGGHPIKAPYVSSSPSFFSLAPACGKTFVKTQKYIDIKNVDGTEWPVVIGNDCWIAKNVIIMCGVTIGDGAVVGAGAFVNKDIPPYAIAVGTPAKIIGYRYNTETIEKLLKIKWWDKDDNWLNENADLFSDLDSFLNYIVL